jgi:hypothetical protein
MEFGDGGFSGGGSGGSFKVDVFNLNHIFKIKTEPLNSHHVLLHALYCENKV